MQDSIEFDICMNDFCIKIDQIKRFLGLSCIHSLKLIECAINKGINTIAKQYRKLKK